MLLMRNFCGTCSEALSSYIKEGQFDLFKQIVKAFILKSKDDGQCYVIVEVEANEDFNSGLIKQKYILKNLSTGANKELSDWIYLDNYDTFRIGKLNNVISMNDREANDCYGNLSEYIGNVVFNNEYGFGRIAGLSGETYAVEYELETGYMGLSILDNETAILNKKVDDKIDMLNYTIELRN